MVKKVNVIQSTDTSNLDEKTDCNTKREKKRKEKKIPNLDKYITTQEFNKLTAENFAAILAQAKLAT